MTRREVERALNDAFHFEAAPFHGVLLVALEAQKEREARHMFVDGLCAPDRASALARIDWFSHERFVT